MKFTRSRTIGLGRAKQNIVRGMLVAIAALAAAGIASAQEDKDVAASSQLQAPISSALVTPIEGNSVFLAGHAFGTQGYVCLPTSTGASWTVNSARPEATLFTNVFGEAVQIITHFLSPDANPNEFAPSPLPFGNATWQSSFDSSKVWAQATKVIPAGTTANCPNSGSIPCLVLQSIGTQEGPTGGKILAKTTFVERLNTNGGAAPATGCSVFTDVGKQSLVPYTADSFFFRADQ